MKELILLTVAVGLSVWCAVETSRQHGSWKAGYEAGVDAGIRATIAEIKRQLAAEDATP